MARPFLKWAGGKGKLASTILAAAPPAMARYIEPFAGAGAVFFAVEEARPGTPALLADANAGLIETYTVLRDELAALDGALAALAAEYAASDGEERSAMYYRVRASAPQSPAERAARFIFLNRTCYNGLFRVNASGGFNVPHGRYKNPRIHDAGLLAACSAALQRAELRVADFAGICEEARPGDFVYLDPPYQPLSATASFTSYTQADFGPADQLRLRDTFEDLSRRGVAAVLSNSDHPVIQGLYSGLGYRLETVPMSRAINSKGAGRAPIPELLIDNFGRVGFVSGDGGRAD
ncbi:MAG: Dam family site-specific DNA-(adenine-N6)-methyltransferase [Chloroflexi bacterium]|nr:Dam family site-specific DNA-(adenine-N6)-methyltransferase [Chloroflexota bacterium]PWB69327.1 MAG: modification methylase [Holophagae bacterium]